MKKRLFLLAFIAACFNAISQSSINLVIFSEDGDAFYAYINGVKQNQYPETNVKFTGISPNISLRLEFENKALPQLKQNMALEPDQEHTAIIRRDMKKQLKLRYSGSVPLEEGVSSSNTVHYHTAGEGSAESYTIQSSPSRQDAASSEQKQVSVNVTMPDVHVNVNNAGENPESRRHSNNTRHSSSDHSNRDHKHHDRYASHSTPSPGCRAAMNQTSFEKMKESIAAKSFSDTKMNTAKLAAKNACLSVSQIKSIAALFSMDDDRLTYAKYAYDYCVDKANYYQISDVFKFSGTTDELNEFLSKVQ